MKLLNSRTFKPIVLAVLIFILFTVKDLLTEMVGGKIGEYLQKNYPFITTTRLVYFLLAILLFAFIYAIYEAIKAKAEKEPQTLTDNLEPDIKLLFDSLTERYKKRYESKLDGRFEITLEVNKEPFSVNYQTNKNVDEAFKAIRESFNQKGRLLIVGSPGSGKTVLLLKLAIELLGKDCKADQKLPVIFNLASWSPDYAKFDDWLIDVLNAGNGLSKDFARTLLEQNRIIFLLDGLDELARNEDVEVAIDKRAKCLDSLNDYLRMGRKAVICCRREEFAQMQTATNQDAPVSAKVEVLDLTEKDIEMALTEAAKHNESSIAATNLLGIIKKHKVFLSVLNTPFYFTTALEVFDKHLLNKKDYPTKSVLKIKKYLLNKFIESKLKHANKLNEFEKNKTKILKWLGWLAKLIEKRGLVDFEFAYLQPNLLAKNWVYKLIFCLLLGASSLILNASVYGIFIGAFFGLVIGKTVINPEDRMTFVFSNPFKNPFFSKVSKSIISLGLFSCFFVSLFRGLVEGIVTGVTISFFMFFFHYYTFSKFVSYYARIKNPYQRMNSGLPINLVASIFLFIIFMIERDQYSYLSNLIRYDAIISILQQITLLFAFFALMFIPLFRHCILRLCLYLERSIPLKYATFLDLAAEARILEKDGGHWRFRHQTLQEHFAKEYDTLQLVGKL